MQFHMKENYYYFFIINSIILVCQLVNFASLSFVSFIY